MYLTVCILGGQDGVDGIATRYGLDGPKKEPRWWRDFLCRPDSPRSPPSLSDFLEGAGAGLLW